MGFIIFKAKSPLGPHGPRDSGLSIIVRPRFLGHPAVAGPKEGEGAVGMSRGWAEGNFNHHLSLPDSGWLGLAAAIYLVWIATKVPLCGALSDYYLGLDSDWPVVIQT